MEIRKRVLSGQITINKRIICIGYYVTFSRAKRTSKSRPVPIDQTSWARINDELSLNY